MTITSTAYHCCLYYDCLYYCCFYYYCLFYSYTANCYHNNDYHYYLLLQVELPQGATSLTPQVLAARSSNPQGKNSH